MVGPPRAIAEARPARARPVDQRESPLLCLNEDGLGRKRVVAGKKPAPPAVPGGAVPRLSRLMALAIRFDGLLRDGVVKDYAELARLGQVTRARLTQIMNLLNLAPDIQEEILFLPPVAGEREAVSERRVRVVAAMADWPKQQSLWLSLWGRDATMPAATAASRDGRERPLEDGHSTSAAATAEAPRGVTLSVEPELTTGNSAVRGM